MTESVILLGALTPQGTGWDSSYNLTVRRRGSNLIFAGGNGRSDTYEPRPAAPIPGAAAGGSPASVRFERNEF